MATRLASFALRFPHMVFTAITVITLIAGLGTTRLRSVSYLEGNLPPNDPELALFNSMIEDFGSDASAVFAFRCENDACETALDSRVLSLVEAVSDEIAAYPSVSSVHSLSTSGILVGSADTLRLERVSSGSDLEARQRFRDRVRLDPIVSGTLISADLGTTAIVAVFDPTLPDAARNADALAMLDRARLLAGEAKIPLYATGLALRAAASDEYVKRDLSSLTPIMVLLLTALLYWVFRHAGAVVLALLTVGIPTVWAFGLMGFMDAPITPVVSTMPIVILVIGLTDAVHFLVRSYDLAGSTTTPRDLVTAVAAEVGPPTTVTALTAALGFLSFLAGPIPNMRQFGLYSAIGILGGWLMTFSLIPAVIIRLSVCRTSVRPPAFQLGTNVLEQVRRFAHRRARVIAAAFAIFFLVALVGVGQIVPENDTTKILGEQNPLVRAEATLRKALRPTDTLEVLIRSDDSVLLPETLRKIERAEEALVDNGNRPILSVLDVLRVANRELAADEGIPTRESLASQLLLISRGANPDGVAKFITEDHRVARISAGYAWTGSDAINADLRTLESRLVDIFGSRDRFDLTGSVVLSNHLGIVVLDSQIASFSTAFVTIFLVIFFYVRSVGLGLLGMIPNVLPVAVVLGLMGFGGVNLDAATAMIGSIVLGVSVDDTIYFLSHYKAARAKGAPVRDAVSLTFAIAGKPALFSATMLSAGFLILGFSSFQSLAVFGTLSALAVLLAAVSEILLLPALLEIFATRSEGGPL